MDLPTCPACKQSVLDEDAVDCPFCGASLKGGASSSRPSAPPARPAKRSSPPAKLDPDSSGSGERLQPGVAKPTAKGSAEKEPGGKSAKEKEADDDPFAVDNAATAKAIATSPRPAPGKTLEVKCPMCETVGYVSPKAAGQQVKCCNPKCLVPIFNAPPPPKVEAPPPPPPKKPPIALYAGIGAILVIGGGIALWQILGSSGGSKPLAEQSPGKKFHNPLLPDEPPTTDGSESPVDDGTKASNKAAVVEVDLKTKALRKAVEVAVNAPQIRKAYCRRLAATAFIAAGDLTGAKDQLDQLQKIGTQTPYEGCLPTTLLAWAQRTQSPNDFAASVAEAKRLTASLPKRGRYAAEASLATAAVLAASGKPAESIEMLGAHPNSVELEELAAASQVVQHLGTYDLDSTLIGRTLGDWQAPRETGIALILAAHGRWDEAQAWAAALSDPVARGEATLAWAEALARVTDPAGDQQKVEAAANALSPALKARFQARLAAVAHQAGSKEKAQESLQKAIQVLQSLPAPGTVSLSTSRAIHDFKLPDPVPLRQAAEAAAEIGLVEAQLGQPGPAWDHFELGLRYLRSTAPALGLMTARLADLEGDSVDRIRTELKSSLQLKTDDQVRRAFARYRQQANDLGQAAARRLYWQAELLEAAANAGLIDPVWNLVQVSEARPDTAEREPLLSTAVPWVVADLFLKAGRTDQAGAARTAAEPRLENATPEHQARIHRELARNSVDTGDIAGAIQRLNEGLSDDGTLHETALRLICRLVKGGKFKEATQLALKLRDTVLREDGLFFASALASRSGKEADAWALVPSSGGQFTESAAIISGLVSGMARADRPK